MNQGDYVRLKEMIQETEAKVSAVKQRLDELEVKYKALNMRMGKRGNQEDAALYGKEPATYDR